MVAITGAILVGAEERGGRATFDAIDPGSGKPVAPPFPEAGAEDVADTCALADANPYRAPRRINGTLILGGDEGRQESL